MLTQLHTDYPVVFDTQTGQGGSAKYVNVSDLSADAQLVSEVMRSSGDKYPTFVYLKRGEPIAEFSSPDLKEYFDAVGVEELLVDSGGAGDGIILYFQKHAQGSMRTAPGTEEHMSLTIGDGVVFANTLTMESGEDAVVSCKIIATSSDGITMPFVSNEAVALPSGIYPQVDNLFTLGKVDLNGTELQGKSRATINFGPQPVPGVNVDSDIYPTYVTMHTFMPRITVVTHHIDILSALTEEGKYYTAEQLTMYARARAEGSKYKSDVTAEHIKFTLGKCRVDWGRIEGNPKTVTLMITPSYTPGGSPVSQLAINTASAIS